MLSNYFTGQEIGSAIESWQIIMLLTNGLVHLVFAGAVARDSGQLLKRGIPTQLVSGIIWAFATLIGGVFVAAIYWLLHHLNFRMFNNGR